MFVVENEVKPADGIISAHLNALKENFDDYFLEETKNCRQKNWTANPSQGDMMTGLLQGRTHQSVRRHFVKNKFQLQENLAQFWLAIQQI